MVCSGMLQHYTSAENTCWNCLVKLFQRCTEFLFLCCFFFFGHVSKKDVIVFNIVNVLFFVKSLKSPFHAFVCEHCPLWKESSSAGDELFGSSYSFYTRCYWEFSFLHVSQHFLLAVIWNFVTYIGLLLVQFTVPIWTWRKCLVEVKYIM